MRWWVYLAALLVLAQGKKRARHQKPGELHADTDIIINKYN